MTDLDPIVLFYLRTRKFSFRFLRFVDESRSVLLNVGLLIKIFLFATFVFNFNGQAYSKDLYPAVYYRSAKFEGVHCTPIGNSKQKRELYMLKKAWPGDVNDGNVKSIEVSEFFSGHRYWAKLIRTKDDQKVKIKTRFSYVELDCGFNKNTIANAPSRSQKIDARGDYLSFERVDASGKWGSVDVDMCDGRGGRVYCDIGVSGLSRRSADGAVRWARIIAVSRKSKYGHPIYKLPDALEIKSEFIWGTLLDDETAILTFNKLLSVRVDLAKGALLEYRPYIAMVSLDSWAALKHIMNERWDGADSPCLNPIKLNKPCEKGLVQMYFYTLQQYLFPANKISWN